MIRSFQIAGFKSWKDTGRVECGKITGFFGANSSGKTSLLQALLLLKQTAETADRAQVLFFGDSTSYTDLGTMIDVLHGHESNKTLRFDLHWDLPTKLSIKDPEHQAELFSLTSLEFHSTIALDESGPFVSRFHYATDEARFGMRAKQTGGGKASRKYTLVSDDFKANRRPGRAWPLPPPLKCYGFPDEAVGYFQNTAFLSDLTLAFERQMGRTFYLGPLRDYPRRIYLWGGDRPMDVGKRGEATIPALLASRAIEPMKWGHGRGAVTATVEARIAYWLKTMELIHSFHLTPLGPNRKEYEVRVKKTATSAEVLVTDVGFGVAQVLPVLVLCFYLPKGSTVILEQPEIHLHPAVQSHLADVLIEAATKRDVQIIVESHSEHLLRRLQTRVAEGVIDNEASRLYFCETANGDSELKELKIDEWGNIVNWPAGFFQEDIKEVVALRKAQVARRTSARPVKKS